MVDSIPELKHRDVLDYDEVVANFKIAMQEVARVYAKAMYIIHYMHDKYYYERAQMAFVVWPGHGSHHQNVQAIERMPD